MYCSPWVILFLLLLLFSNTKLFYDNDNYVLWENIPTKIYKKCAHVTSRTYSYNLVPRAFSLTIFKMAGSREKTRSSLDDPSF